MTRGNTDGVEQKTLWSAAKCDHFRTFTPRDRGSGIKYKQSTHNEAECVHRQPQKAMQVQGSRADTKLQLLEQPGHSMRRKVLGKAEQQRSEEIWMVAAQVQVNHPFFFSIVSFHMCPFPRTSCLSPPGNLVGMKSQCCICLSRISTCPSGLSDSWSAEHPEIQDRLTAH